jgi:uncharacterized protein with HEPN domain
LDNANKADLIRLQAEYRKRQSEQDFYQRWLLKLIDEGQEGRDKAEQEGKDRMLALKAAITDDPDEIIADKIDNILSKMSQEQIMNYKNKMEDEKFSSVDAIKTVAPLQALKVVAEKYDNALGEALSIYNDPAKNANEVKSQFGRFYMELDSHITGTEVANLSSGELRNFAIYADSLLPNAEKNYAVSTSGFLGRGVSRETLETIKRNQGKTSVPEEQSFFSMDTKAQEERDKIAKLGAVRKKDNLLVDFIIPERFAFPTTMGRSPGQLQIPQYGTQKPTTPPDKKDQIVLTPDFEAVWGEKLVNEKDLKSRGELAYDLKKFQELSETARKGRLSDSEKKYFVELRNKLAPEYKVLHQNTVPSTIKNIYIPQNKYNYESFFQEGFNPFLLDTDLDYSQFLPQK